MVAIDRPVSRPAYVLGQFLFSCSQLTDLNFWGDVIDGLSFSGVPGRDSQDLGLLRDVVIAVLDTTRRLVDVTLSSVYRASRI